jgi:hypothetical protein
VLRHEIGIVGLTSLLGVVTGFRSRIQVFYFPSKLTGCEVVLQLIVFTMLFVYCPEFLQETLNLGSIFDLDAFILSILISTQRERF